MSEVGHESHPVAPQSLLDITNNCINGQIKPQEAFSQLIKQIDNQSVPLKNDQSSLSTNPLFESELSTQQEINQIKTEINKLIITKDEYYFNKEKKLTQINGGGFIDSHQIRYDKFGPNYKNSLINKADNQACILKLKISGIKKSKEFHQSLHERGFDNFTIRDKEIIKNLKDLSPTEISKGLDRINKLGFDLSNRDLAEKEVALSIKKISSVDGHHFNQVTSELNQYSFLSNSEFKQENTLYNYHYKYNYDHNRQYRNEISSEDGVNPVFKVLLNKIEQGHVESEVKNRLDLIKEIFLLENHLGKNKELINIKPKGENYLVSPKLEELLSKNQNFVFKTPNLNNLDTKIFDNNYNFIYQNIDYFDNESKSKIINNMSFEEVDNISDKNGTLSFLKQLSTYVSNKYDFGNSVNYVLSNRNSIVSNYNDDSQKSSFLLELIQKKSTDPYEENNRAGFVNTLVENLPLEIIDAFPDQKDQNFWNLVKDLGSYYYIKPILENNPDYLTSDNLPTSKFFDVQASGSSRDRLKDLIKDKYLVNFSQEDQTFWLVYSGISRNSEDSKLLIDLKNSLANFSESDSSSKEQFYSDISKKLLILSGKVLDNNINPKAIFDFIKEDTINLFSPNDRDFWNFFKNNKWATENSVQRLLLNNKDNFTGFFNSNNQPTDLFFRSFINENPNSDLIKFITPEFINNRPDDESKFWYKIRNIGYHAQNVIVDKFCEGNLSVDKIFKYISIYEVIDRSPSKEILRLKDQILDQLIKGDNPLENYEQISNIFIKNNLPEVGKVFKVFNVLYPPSKIKEMLSNTKLSPILRHYRSPHQLQNIIYKDLINIHLNSGNRSLNTYIKVFSDNNEIVDKCFRGKSLNSKEQQKISYFLAKLDTLYDNSFLTHINASPKTKPKNISERIKNLYETYHVKDGQTIGDRVAEMFLSPAGIKNIDEAKNIISSVKQKATQKNLEIFLKLTENKFKLDQGDLIKGINGKYLENILENGSVAKEYLGSSSNSDSTPFDTDTIKVSAELSQKDFKNIITSSPSYGYGNITLIVKDRGQFQDTSQSDTPIDYQSDKLEIFNSGFVSNDHFGIRTGFPSSEIDCFVVKKDSDNIAEVENIFYQIAQHGVYIPVANEEGGIIFTPLDYDRYRKVFDGVEQFDGQAISVKLARLTDWSYPLINELKNEINTNIEEVKSKDNQIRDRIKNILTSSNIKLKDEFDTGLLGASLQNIGSSGRNTNLPGDFDFDYTLILDGTDYEKTQAVRQGITHEFNYDKDIPAASGDDHIQIRMSHVTDIGDTPIDIDVGINTKADTLVFSSNNAIEQKLDSIRRNSGEDIYQEVIANILLTKKILKENHAYKKGDYQDGGFGGIGVENWILANNGSIDQAFKTFWETSHIGPDTVSLSEFSQKYPILDAGINIRFPTKPHDNFSAILTEQGYQKMINVIGKYFKTS